MSRIIRILIYEGKEEDLQMAVPTWQFPATGRRNTGLGGITLTSFLIEGEDIINNLGGKYIQPKTIEKIKAVASEITKDINKGEQNE